MLTNKTKKGNATAVATVIGVMAHPNNKQTNTLNSDLFRL